MINYSRENLNEIIRDKNDILNKKDFGDSECKSIDNKDLKNNNLKEYIIKECPNFCENFELLNCIGIGSESKVYKAKFKKYNKTIAIKIILRDKEEKKNINEVKISKKLKYKNIIDFYSIFTIKKDKLDCIMMEYGDLGNLINFKKNILKGSYLSESLLCYISYQILKGLKYCQKSKVAHLDIKPQNIILNDYLDVKLIDFSISMDYSKINSDFIKIPFRGTNFYISPEIFENKTIKLKDINKIDLYSLGVVLFYLAFGYYPFGLSLEDANNYDKIYNKIMKDLEIKNENNWYSSHFIDFLKKLLEKDINKRLDINEALNHYWIKGAKILLDEKEKINNISIFLIYLMRDQIIRFVHYLNQKI